ALRLGHGTQGVEQLRHVRAVIGRFSRIARRTHPGLAAERVDAEAGVVRDRGQSARARSMARFRERVLDEGRTLLGRRLDAELVLWHELYIEPRIAQQRAKLGELAAIARREDPAPSGAHFARISA